MVLCTIFFILDGPVEGAPIDYFIVMKTERFIKNKLKIGIMLRNWKKALDNAAKVVGEGLETVGKIVDEAIVGEPLHYPSYERPSAHPRDPPPPESDYYRFKRECQAYSMADIVGHCHNAMGDGDEVKLGRILEFREDFFRNSRDPYVIKTHAIACLYLRRDADALKSYLRLDERSGKEEAVIGFICSKLGNKDLALKHFKKVKGKNLDVILARCSIGYLNAEGNVKSFREDLEDHLDTSAEANWFLGAVSFNNGRYDVAEKYLEKAADLGRSDERFHLDLLKTKANAGQLKQEDIGRFYTETSSSLSPEDFEAKMAEEYMEIPDYNYKGSLYKLMRGK